jgi:hypothetical protein
MRNHRVCAAFIQTNITLKEVSCPAVCIWRKKIKGRLHFLLKNDPAFEEPKCSKLTSKPTRIPEIRIQNRFD